MKEKKRAGRLIAWGAVLAALAALVIFVLIPLYSMDDSQTENPVTVEYYSGKEKTLRMESDALVFEMDTATTQFTVTDKRNSMVWRSNPENAAGDPVALAANKEMLQSTLAVTCTTSSGYMDYNNFKYSVENQSYTIDTLEDGAIQVNYAIGKIEKTYRIPLAATVERFEGYLANMDKNTADKKVKANYTLYKPEELSKKGNAEEIIAAYPEVQNQALYVLKGDANESTKKKLEGYFEKAGYTQEDYDTDMLLSANASAKTGAVFNVSVIYRLEGPDLVVEIPYESIRCKQSYPITALTVLPMFGAAGTDEDGFMFVPEGGGALIYNNNGKYGQSSYYSNLYGWDYASERTEVVSETRNDFPVFGMSKNGASFVCMIEGAASYAGIQADVSLRNNSYNWLCAKYKVIHYDQYNVSAKTAQLVYMFEKEIPADTAVQRYRFLTGDSYVDMANAYGEYLCGTREAYAGKTASEDMPVSVELVGAINKTVEKFGVPVDTVIPTTTFEQASGIMDDLLESGVRNLNVRMTGWCNGGVNQKVFSRVKVERVLGGEKGMTSLIEKAKADGVGLYFDGISCFAYDSGLLEGFIGFRDAARYTTREQVKLYPYDPITFQPSDWTEIWKYYLVTPKYAQEKASNLVEKLDTMGAAGISFRDIGKLLSADYNPNRVVTREETLAMNLDILQKTRNSGMNVMVRQGNDYVLDYADLITDMVFVGHRYSILDASVPFYQIALHGKMDYTGEPVNISSDYVSEILRCAEYGSGLNFTFMTENTRILQNTIYSGYYSSYYANWAERVGELITRYQSEMAGLNTQRIIGHTQVDEEVFRTLYEDGTAVYVNYSEEDCTADGITVPARDYAVRKENAA